MGKADNLTKDLCVGNGIGNVSPIWPPNCQLDSLAFSADHRETLFSSQEKESKKSIDCASGATAYICHLSMLVHFAIRAHITCLLAR